MRKMYNVIFLDIDGVLNSFEWFRFCYKHKKRNRDYAEQVELDPNKVNKLAKYCKTHNIKIIVTSCWRWNDYKSTIENFSKHRKLLPLIDHIVGITIRTLTLTRGQEIQNMLDSISDSSETYMDMIKEPFGVDKFVILDDDEDMLESQHENFIHVDGDIGLCRKDYIRMNKIFGISKN